MSLTLWRRRFWLCVVFSGLTNKYFPDPSDPGRWPWLRSALDHTSKNRGCFRTMLRRGCNRYSYS